ncbi:hypothetical protein AGMMS49992_11140 [Clostridia bacterium]|nr:hypothetical protein AGMMS49992_11140 [Clostridia bacterium]
MLDLRSPRIRELASMWDFDSHDVDWTKDQLLLSDIWLIIHLAGVEKHDDARHMLNGIMQSLHPNALEDIIRLERLGFLRFITGQRTFDHFSLAQIKSWLQQQNIKVSGTKQEIVKYINANLSQEIIASFLGESMYYYPTKLSYSYIRSLYEMRSLAEWHSFDSIKKKDYDNAIFWLWEGKESLTPIKDQTLTKLRTSSRHWVKAVEKRLRDVTPVTDSAALVMLGFLYGTVLFVGFPSPTQIKMSDWRGISVDSKEMKAYKFSTFRNDLIEDHSV